MTVADRIMARSPGARSVLALLLVPVGALLAWALVVQPIHWVITSQSDWRESTTTELARARGHAQLLEAVRKQVDELPSAPLWQRFYVVGAGESISGAVHKDVTELCMTAGLNSQSITPLPSEKLGAMTRQPVRLVAMGTSDRLQAFLARLREHPRYLRVDRLNVSAPQLQGADQNPVLTVTMDIAGYAASMAATPGKGK
jgi:hypothetical protein